MNVNMENNIGMKIAALRNYLGLSKSAFAREIHMSPTHLDKLENNIYQVKKSILDTICSAFNVNPDYFTPEVPASDVYKMTANMQKVDELSVSQRIRTLRKEKHMTQVELAEKSGASQSVISGVESGARILTERQAEKIAAALEVGSDYLLYGDVTKKKYPVNEKMIDWLWKHEEERKAIWIRIHKE